MDKIRLHDLRCQVRIGLTEEERSRPQRVILDIDLDLNLAQAGKSDDISQTCDYKELVDAICSHVESHSFNLLEALAESVSSFLLENQRVKGLRVRAHKFPEAIRNRIHSVAVELRRKRVD